MAFNDARKERGLYLAEMLRNERVSPHMVRLTLGGEDLARLPQHGFDHWVRLFFPHPEHGTPDFSHLPETFGLTGYVRYLTQRSGTRPAVRSYTIREHRGDEVDIDFVSHGDDGLAGPWAAKAEPGERVTMIDQGCGFDLRPDADFQLLVGDESAMPAILGILRDLPGEAKGLAIIEVPDPDDAQEVVGPDGSRCGGSCARIRTRVRGRPRSPNFAGSRPCGPRRSRRSWSGSNSSRPRGADIWSPVACRRRGSSSAAFGGWAAPPTDPRPTDVAADSFS